MSSSASSSSSGTDVESLDEEAQCSEDEAWPTLYESTWTDSSPILDLGLSEEIRRRSKEYDDNPALNGSCKLKQNLRKANLRRCRDLNICECMCVPLSLCRLNQIRERGSNGRI